MSPDPSYSSKSNSARYKNLWAIIRCGALFFVRGKASRVPASPARIMVVQTAQLGDMVCTTPFFRAIKKHYPKTELVVLGNVTNRSLLENNSDIDRYIVYDHATDIDILISDMKRLNIDVACITAPDYRLLSILYLARIPLIVVPKVVNGWSPYETFLYRLLRNIAVMKPHIMGSYAPREYLRLLEPIGIVSRDTKKYLRFSSRAQETAAAFLHAHNVAPGRDLIIGVSASAGNQIKKWHPERFAAVIDHIVASHQAPTVSPRASDASPKIWIILIGGPDDSQDVAAVLAHVSAKSKHAIINAQGKFTIDELKAFIASLSVLIAVDTGPIYIAEAFSVPTIDIIGPIDEKEQPPISDIHCVVVAARRAPALHVMNARAYDEQEAGAQVDAISVDMVTKVFDDLVARRGFKKGT